MVRVVIAALGLLLFAPAAARASDDLAVNPTIGPWL